MTDPTPTPEEISRVAARTVGFRWAKRTDAVCPQCGQTFSAKSGQKWCSTSCHDAAWNARRKERKEIKRG